MAMATKVNREATGSRAGAQQSEPGATKEMGLDTLSASSASAMNRLQSNVVKAFTGYYRLKDFIHELRACKTQAAERALIARESFAIRTAFKEEAGEEQRYHSVAKLLYIYMLGYPAHFGQIECLKLAASARLTDKRMGLLGVQLLLDEEQQPLRLVTNSLKSDLNAHNPTVVGLALSALSCVAGGEMAWELADEVSRLLSSPNAGLRRRAAFCAARLAEKVPDLADQFSGRIAALIADQRSPSHGTILGGISLALTLLKLGGPTLLAEFKVSLLPSLVRLLHGLLGSNSYAADQDVGGINDPFLQVALLRLLRQLGRGDADASDRMADVLTQLAASTDASRQAGQAVLYEGLLTILTIRADAQLRAMAVGQLARLLGQAGGGGEPNIRYMALHLLGRVAGQDAGAGAELVARYRDTVLDCLHDPDVSIRREAVELALALLSRSTAKDIVPKLLGLLALPGQDPDLSAALCQSLALQAASVAPSTHWYVDTLALLLGAMPPGTPAKEEIVSSFLRVLNNTPALHVYATRTLYEAVLAKSSSVAGVEEALIQAAAWCLGEYGHLLARDTLVTPEQIIEALIAWSSATSSPHVQLYLVTALGKLSHRFEPCLSAIQSGLQSISKNACDDSVALRAAEMLVFASSAALRARLFQPIPPESNSYKIADAPDALLVERSDSPAPTVDVFAELALLSLDGLRSGSGVSSSATSTQQQSAATLPFSTLALPAVAPATTAKDKACYSAHGLTLHLRLIPDSPSGQNILLTASSTDRTISSLQVLCAVPKSLRIVLDPPSSSTVLPSAPVTQLMRVTSADDPAAALDASKIKLRIRASFVPATGQQITDTFEVASL